MSGTVENGCKMSARVAISPTHVTLPEPTFEGDIAHLEVILVPPPVFVPAGLSRVEFRLSWEGNWAHYPTNDLDMNVYLFDGGFNQIFVDADGNPFTGSGVPQGFTRDSPEVVPINSPTEGFYFFDIIGAEVNSPSTEHWELRVVEVP